MLAEKTKYCFSSLLQEFRGSGRYLSDFLTAVHSAAANVLGSLCHQSQRRVYADSYLYTIRINQWLLPLCPVDMHVSLSIAHWL